MGIIYRVERNVVRAYDGDERIGRTTVPEIDFQWADGVRARMAGISGVGTEEQYRRRGIAAAMMEEAVAFSIREGYACSGITTAHGSVARRLYSRAGYTTLFKPGCFVKRVRPGAMPCIDGFSIRPFEDGDEESLVALFEETYRPYFGLRRKTATGWRHYRREVLEQDPERIAIAEDDTGVLGWAGNFKQWVGLVSEVWVRPCGNREGVAQALLTHLERRMASQGLDESRLWASPADAFSADLAVRNGYAFSEQRVFMLRILDLPALLGELLPLFNCRAADPLPWQGVLGLETPLQQACLIVSEAIAVDASADPCVSLTMSQPILTKLLSGTLSAWEAYLLGELGVTPGMTPDLKSTLERLFPATPAFHPADDMW